MYPLNIKANFHGHHNHTLRFGQMTTPKFWGFFLIFINVPFRTNYSRILFFTNDFRDNLINDKLKIDFFQGKME